MAERGGDTTTQHGSTANIDVAAVGSTTPSVGLAIFAIFAQILEQILEQEEKVVSH